MVYRPSFYVELHQSNSHTMWSSWPSRRKKPTETGETRIVKDLTQLLNSHGDKILEGKGKFSLTTHILITLNKNFSNLIEGTDSPKFEVVKGEKSPAELAKIFDFVQKTVSLKIISGPVCQPCHHLNVAYFKSLETLEVRKVPIVYIRGLHFLTKQLKTLICCRSTNSIKDVVYQFSQGANGMSTVLDLTSLDLSYNTITALDPSVKLLPSLKRLNLSHNCLSCVDTDHLPDLCYMNLAYNTINHIPTYPVTTRMSLTTLNLRNNNLDSLQGVQLFMNLRSLDISANCLASLEDLFPLAQLHNLIALDVAGNPLAFVDNYRMSVITRLSPVAREEPVYLDGKVLGPDEVLFLGKDVEPVSLRNYIPHEPMGRPHGSLKNLAKSLLELSTDSAPVASTPKPKKIGRKVRQATIADPSFKPTTSVAIRRPGSDPSNDRLSLRADSISSRKSSLDDCVVWVHKAGNEEVEISRSLQNLDYTSFDEGENTEAGSSMSGTDHDFNADDQNQRIYSNAPVRLGSMERLQKQMSTSSSGSSVDVISEDEMKLYLVERIDKSSFNGMVEKFSVFLVLKEPYLLEKDPLSGSIVERLDLNYLVEVTPHPDGSLTVSLKFDLLRADRQHRSYIFEDPEGMQDFDEFVNILTPIAVRNRQRARPTMEHWQCLKCSMSFLTKTRETSFHLCPFCGSSMTVEKTRNSMDHESSDEENTIPGSPPSASTNQLPNGKHKTKSSTVAVDHNNEEDNKPVKRASSSIAVLIPFRNSNTDDTSSPSRSWPADVNSNSSVPKNSPQTENIRTYGEASSNQEMTDTAAINFRLGESPQVNGIDHPDGNEMVTSQPYEIDSTAKSNEIVDTSKLNGVGVTRKITPVANMFVSMKPSSPSPSTSSTSRSSLGKMNFEQSPSGSRASTPSTSYESRRSYSRHSRSRSTTPSSNLPSNHIVFNKDELKKCDHRLKLFFNMELFHEEEEQFNVLLKCTCVVYGKEEEIDCLLVVSNKNIYILKTSNSENYGSSPKDWIRRIAKYRLQEVKYIDYGYFNQSFRLEFSKENASYKFLVRDSERCQKFIAFLLGVIQEFMTTKSSFPLVSEEPNPEILANIKSQLFGIEEDLLLTAKRLFEQATVYREPPLLKNRKIRIRTHHLSFYGKEMVDWLVARKEVNSREKAVRLCQKFVDVGLIYHVSKELQFVDSEALYKFEDFTDNHKKSGYILDKSNSFKTRESLSSDTEIDTTLCLYMLGHVIVLDNELSNTSLKPRTISVTKTHIVLSRECHQWPLPRQYLPPTSLRKQFELIKLQKVIDITRLEFYEDSPCFVSVSFADEYASSSESTWLISTETVREMTKLVELLKTIWEGQLAVKLQTDVLPTIQHIIS